MTEDEISQGLFSRLASLPSVKVLSWQGVGGKSYLTRDIQFRADGKRVAPDLVVMSRRRLWLIEIKGSHHEAARGDEGKLAQLRLVLGEQGIRLQVSRRSGVPVANDLPVTLAVAYSSGGAESSCRSDVVHLAWEGNSDRVVELIERA